MLAKATNDVNGTTTTVTSAIPTGETTKSLKLSATGNKATANATIPISKADNPQKTLTIEYDTIVEVLMMRLVHQEVCMLKQRKEMNYGLHISPHRHSEQLLLIRVETGAMNKQCL